jgi:formylglycine-generating enzyme required for sulfatase activity
MEISNIWDDLTMPLLLKKQKHTAKFFREKLDDAVGLDMMLIPGGSFKMGSPEDEIDRSPDESLHDVTVPTFCMGKYPITQAQWQVVANSNPELNTHSFRFTGVELPADNVSWDEATKFCVALSTLTQRTYRLPSEAEWEYACRAGTTTPFHFGKTITTDLANYDGTDDKNNKWSGSYGKGPKGIYRRQTTPVGTFPPNAFGLYDMHGNVWEWCQDTWHSNYDGAPNDGSAWIDENDNDYHILRGGSWVVNPQFCRSAFRNHNCFRDYDVGFRVVCEAARTP